MTCCKGISNKYKGVRVIGALNRYRSQHGKACGPCGADHLLWCCMGCRATKELTEATQRLETRGTGDEAGSSVARPGAAGPRGANEAPQDHLQGGVRNMITRRASVTALVAVAVAGLASGCLSSNSGGGSSGGGTASGPGKATVEVMYGFSNEQDKAFQKD